MVPCVSLLQVLIRPLVTGRMTEQTYSTTASLSSWLANMKADDIDGGLAANFDGSLSGLGVELGSSTYNMRYHVH